MQVCRHHAAAVAQGAGTAQNFTCPYHGSAWDPAQSTHASAQNMVLSHNYPAASALVWVRSLLSSA